MHPPQRRVGAVERVLLRGTPAACRPRAGSSRSAGSACRRGRRAPRARRRRRGTSRRRCSRRGRRRSRGPRARAARRRCSSRRCRRRRRRTRSARSPSSPAAAPSGSARPGCGGRASRSGSSSAGAARRPVTRAFTEWPIAGVVRMSRRATTRRKSGSRATSSRTRPAPPASSTTVSSVIACGSGSPDSTPWEKRPPRSMSFGRRGRLRFFAASASCGATTATAAAPELARNWRRVGIRPRTTHRADGCSGRVRALTAE